MEGLTGTQMEALAFEEADRLCWQILKAIWRNVDRRKPTHYETHRLAEVQANIITGIATGRYVLLVDDGDIKAFACWQTDPLFITEATASKGWMPKLARAVKQATGERFGMWYRSKNGKWFRGIK